MKGIVVYGGKYGSTEEYAKWIAKESGFDAVPLKKAKDISAYPTVVVGGSIKMGKNDAFKWMQKNRSLLEQKKVHLFTVSGAGANSEESGKFQETSTPQWLTDKASYHAFPGRWDPADGSFLFRFLANQLAKKESGDGPMTVMAKGFDRMDKESIKPLVELL